jgi:ubiquinone/menaquinone biosynthesis C-methylase UbiE
MMACGYTAVGVDVSIEGIDRARVRYPECDFCVKLVNSHLPFKDAAFDLVWSSEVIEHLFDVHSFRVLDLDAEAAASPNSI